ncbi:MAG: hypothetical protein ACKPKO_65965, partial [Candidatus Fonsibacter sp.]
MYTASSVPLAWAVDDATSSLFASSLRMISPYWFIMVDWPSGGPSGSGNGGLSSSICSACDPVFLNLGDALPEVSGPSPW